MEPWDEEFDEYDAWDEQADDDGIIMGDVWEDMPDDDISGEGEILAGSASYGVSREQAIEAGCSPGQRYPAIVVVEDHWEPSVVIFDRHGDRMAGGRAHSAMVWTLKRAFEQKKPVVAEVVSVKPVIAAPTQFNVVFKIIVTGEVGSAPTGTTFSLRPEELHHLDGLVSQPYPTQLRVDWPLSRRALIASPAVAGDEPQVIVRIIDMGSGESLPLGGEKSLTLPHDEAIRLIEALDERF